MTISNITFRKIITDGKLKAIVSVDVDDCFRIDGIKVIQGNERLFIGMPSRQLADGGFADMVHAIHPEERGKIEVPVLNAYMDYVAQMTN